MRLRSARRKKVGFAGIFVKVIVPLVLILALFIFLKLDSRYWNGNDKFAVAYPTTSGDAAVVVLDPKLSEVTTFIIPGDTQVDVARSYGTLRIKNVWQLGKNEKMEGALLAETITQNFLFPTHLWADSEAASLGDGEFIGILKFVFSPLSTNINLGDRLLAGTFALKVGERARTKVDLGKSQFLTKQILSDGQKGFVAAGTIPAQLTVYFSDNDVGSAASGKNLRINIIDATGRVEIAQKVGQILEVMGGKVVSVDRRPETDGGGCLIYGKNLKIVKKVASLFSCRVGEAATNFDLEVFLDSQFAKSF
jgi:hypothetical protein